MPRIVNLANISQFAAASLSDPGYLPGPRIIPNACQVRLNWALTDGRIGHNVCYSSYTGSPALSSTVAQSVFAQMTAGATWTGLAGFLASTTLFTGVTVLDMRSSTATAFDSTGSAVAGTAAGTALPDEVAAVITLRTGSRGPSGRGRVYIPGWSSTAVGPGGVIAAAAVTALESWAVNSFFLGFGVIGPMVLAHQHRQAYTSPATGRLFPDRPAGTVPITALPVRDNHWDSQRRRGLK